MIKGTQRNPHDRPEPLVEGLNVMVMTMAHLTNPFGWNIETSYIRSPRTLADLNLSVSKTGRIVVWGEGSDSTIYACKEHNAAFRAWHDSVHYRCQLPMNFAGEAGVVYVQIGQMLNQYGHDEEVEKWAAYLLCEVLGQALEHNLTGEFPADQRAFAVSNVARWVRLAREVCAHLSPDVEATEQDAVRLAASTWGRA